DNVGRLLEALDRHNLAQNTVVIFMSDNGPQQPRYNGGLRGLKGTVYEGGIRVPCFVRWPARVTPGRHIDRAAAHIDVPLTLLDACGVQSPADRKLDGRSLLPLLAGQAGDWSERSLFFQWHRGDEPERARSCAVRTQRWKLVQPQRGPAWQLFDI